MSIRQKVMIGLTVSFLAVACIGAISYSYLRTIKTKLHVVEIADDLSNLILEIRRYEKNYLLYGSLDDLRENLDYIRQAKLVMTSMQPEVVGLSIISEFNRLSRSIQDYAAAIDQLLTCAAADSETCAGISERLRESGKELVDVSHLLVRFERDQIMKNINSLETNLVSSLLILFIVGFGFSLLVGARIIRPLKRIEDSTLRIAAGDFTPLSSPATRDETQRVIDAFNRMIAELEKRQEQLVQAKKLSSIGILASGIAHQLNNPLNNISTSLQIVNEEFGQGDPDFTRRLLRNCGQEILRAQEIVKGLLEFSRQRDFELRSAALADVVQRSIRLVSSQVPAGIDIQSDVPADLALRMDVQRMQEVFINLLMNAVQAIEEVPGHVRVRAHAIGSPPDHAVEIVVEDSGKGIPPDDIGRIFDPFFTTKEVGAGTGLGLSIAYGIIQKHRGGITVDSRRGEGTRFTIRLPMATAGEGET